MNKETRFTELVLRGFGRYRDETSFSFAEGTNVFRADNEVGKSTMAAGLCAVIFGLPSTSDVRAFGTERYRNWEEPSDFSGEVAIVDASHEYRIVRNFISHRVRVKMRDGEQWREIVRGTHNPRANKPNVNYHDFLHRLIGMDNGDLFRQTYFIEQPLPPQGSLSIELRQLLSGGGHFERVRERLQQELKSLTKYPNLLFNEIHPGRKDQLLEEKEAEIASLRAQYDSSMSKIAELQSVTDTLAALRSELTAKQRELDTARSKRLVIEHLLELEETMKSATEERRRLKLATEQVAELESAMLGVKAELESNSALQSAKSAMLIEARRISGDQEAFPDDDSVKDRLYDELHRADAAEMRLERRLEDGLHSAASVEELLGSPEALPDGATELLKSLAELRSNAAGPALDSGALFSGMAIGLLIYWFGGSDLPGGVALFLAGSLFVSVILSLYMPRAVLRRAAKRKVKEISRVIPASAALKALELSELVTLLSELEAEPIVVREETLHAARESAQRARACWVAWQKTTDEWRRLLGEERDLIQRAEASSIALREVVRAHGVASSADLRKDLARADDDYFFARRALAEYRARNAKHSAHLHEGSLDESRAVLSDCTQEIMCHQEDIVHLTDQIRHLTFQQSRLEGSQLVSLAFAEEHMLRLVAERDNLRREAQALGIALAELSLAVREFQNRYREEITVRVSEHYRAMTGGTRSVHMTDSFELKVREHNGRDVDLAQLSRGAEDQLYLAARLAIADFLSSGRRFPLILDDPFLTSDDERLIAIRAALTASARQVILLTHSPRFASWGKNIDIS